MRVVLSLVFVVVSVLGDEMEDPFENNVELDYTRLAGEAEVNKGDILNFLNQPHVIVQYQRYYNTLLSKLSDHNNNVLSGDPQINDETRRDSTRRIVAGHNTSIAAVPWQVSLRQKTFPMCGGSVLTDIWLLTAAHCLMKVPTNELNVRLGSSWKTHGGEMYDVKGSFVHPQYNSRTKVNDAGLVQLYAPLRFTNRILPIRMVAKGKKLLAQQSVIVSGWGKLKEGGPSATYLQSSYMKTIAMKLCRSSGLDKDAIEPKAMFCAGSFNSNSPDACQGDSGGPIVSDGVLIGVVSWGLGCARGNFPGVYTRLSHPIIWDWVWGKISHDNNTVCNDLRSLDEL